jgi:hypothetical protein
MNPWPQSDLDPVRRLRVLAAGLPHVALVEGVIDAPFERVWGLVGDVERGVPRFEQAVRSVEIVQRRGDELELIVVHPLGVRVRFRAVLQRGWCVMGSRWGDVGMAATAEGGGARTRFAHFEGSRLLGRAGRPWFRRNVRGDFSRITALLHAPPPRIEADR